MNLQAYANPAEMPASEAIRVGRLLALDRPDRLSDVQLARRVAGGLPSQAAIALAETLGRKRVVGPVVPEAPSGGHARRSRDSPASSANGSTRSAASSTPSAAPIAETGTPSRRS